MATLFGMIAGGCANNQRQGHASGAVPAPKSYDIGAGYTVVISPRSLAQDVLSIRSGDELVYWAIGGRFWMGAAGLPAVPVALLGDDGSYLVVQELYGRVGPVVFNIFRLTPEFSFVARIYSPLGGHFEDVGRSGRYAIVIPDYSYAALSGLAEQHTPAPEVVLSFHGGRYQVDAGLTRARLLPIGDLAALRKQLRQSWSREPPKLFHEIILNYLYAGRISEGWRLFDELWPSDIPERERSKAVLEQLIRSSTFGPTLVAPPELEK